MMYHDYGTARRDKAGPVRTVTLQFTAQVPAGTTDAQVAAALASVLAPAWTWLSPFVRAGENQQAGPWATGITVVPANPACTVTVAVEDPAALARLHVALLGVPGADTTP